MPLDFGLEYAVFVKINRGYLYYLALLFKIKAGEKNYYRYITDIGVNVYHEG